MLRTISYKQLITFFYCLAIAAMVISPVLLSISMFGLCALAVFKIEKHPGKISFGINYPGLKRMKNMLNYPAFVVLFLFFIIAVVRFYPIYDLDYLFIRFRIKTPFVLLPLAFIALPRINEEDLKKLLYFMLVFFSIVSFGILINYCLNFEVLTEQIRKGHHIPTPRNHIRYSLLAALAVINGGFLYLKKYHLKYKKERWLIAGLTLFMFLFLHVLSVKSGILVMYICLGFGLLQYIWIKKQILIGTIGLTLLVCVPVIAYQTLPTFHNKVDYFRYDMFMHNNGEGANYSDSGRLASIQAGWAIAKDNWLWGVGTANVRKAVGSYYKEHYSDYPEVFMPQNQFLFSWISAGIFGLLLTIIAFFTPLFYRKNYKHPLFLNFYLSIFVIIMIEHALENAVGVAHYLFFLLFFLSVLNRSLPLSEIGTDSE